MEHPKESRHIEAAERVVPWVEVRPSAPGMFVYKRMIRAASPDARPGQVVAVYDRGGQALGCAHYNPHSQIALRMLRAGFPGVDEAFWRDAIFRAAQLRVETLRLPEMTDACRMIHSEGDGLSGLVADRYGDVLAVELYSLGMYRMIERLLPLVHEACGTRRHRVETSARVQELEGFQAKAIRSADLPDELKITENGVRFRVSFTTGHKTGFFCDQRENRRRFAERVRGGEVLDACAYTGGFGLYAAVLGGAKAVTCVDLDEEAVALLRRNADLNQVRVDAVHADAFGYLRQMQMNGRMFDAVVLDPPKLVFGLKDEGDGRRKYFDLNRLAMPLVRSGGWLLTCSCSGALRREEFVQMLRTVAHQTGRAAQLVELTGAGPDHPVRLDYPEGEYLKAAWLRLT